MAPPSLKDLKHEDAVLAVMERYPELTAYGFNHQLRNPDGRMVWAFGDPESARFADAREELLDPPSLAQFRLCGEYLAKLERTRVINRSATSQALAHGIARWAGVRIKVGIVIAAAAHLRFFLSDTNNTPDVSINASTRSIRALELEQRPED